MTQALEDYTPQRVVALDTYSPAELKFRLGEMKQETAILQEFFAEVMHPSRPGTADGDYGVIPGTAKPTLLKPGAEKLLEYYAYAPTIKAIDETADRQTGFYRARVTVALVSKRTGAVVAEGVGECNTMEGRFRWRNAERVCPECSATAIIKGKEEYGGGWLCWAKKGGCGAKFTDSDQAIMGQTVGKVENDDPWGLWNTVLKQAKKRGLIDATLSATRSSGLFTQDMEELSGWVEGEVISSRDNGGAVTPDMDAARPARADAASPRGASGSAAVSTTSPRQPNGSAPSSRATRGSGGNVSAFWAKARELGDKDAMFLKVQGLTGNAGVGGKSQAELDALLKELQRSVPGGTCKHEHTAYDVKEDVARLVCSDCGSLLEEEPEEEAESD